MTSDVWSEVDAALRTLRAGRPVVMPTDTVYGIGAVPSIPDAVESIFSLKGRPGDKPLPVLAASVEELERVVAIDDRARRLTESYWPGPLSLVLPRASAFTYDLGGSYAQSVAVRVPACDVALELLRASGPLAVTSANRSGMPPAHSAGEARRALPGVEVVVDGGRCAGQVSTVLSLAGEATVLREGAISEAELLSALGG